MQVFECLFIICAISEVDNRYNTCYNRIYKKGSKMSDDEKQINSGSDNNTENVDFDAMFEEDDEAIWGLFGDDRLAAAAMHYGK